MEWRAGHPFWEGQRPLAAAVIIWMGWFSFPWVSTPLRRCYGRESCIAISESA